MASEKSRFELVVSNNYHQLATELAKRVLELSRSAIKARGEFTIALSGGTTPKGLYLRMTESDLRNEFKWQSMHFFWGDERWVPFDHIKSNYRMAAEVMLAKCDVPVENLHPIRTKEGFPDDGAKLYEEELTNHFKLKKGEFPEFDLILLGLGHDGGIASHFPGNPSLEEKKRLAVAVTDSEAEEPRVTLTIPVINRARHIIYIVSGREKAGILNTILTSGGSSDVILPAQLVQPEKGTLSWYVDKAAMAVLETKIPSA